jgi:RNA polymerase sigma-70 factor (ECF subfamily)
MPKAVNNLNNLINTDVYKQCFLDNYEGLHSYAFNILKDNEEARDIVQLAFVKLWQKRQEVDLVGAGRAYLYKSVYHLSLNVIRSRKVRYKYRNNVLVNTTDACYDNIMEIKEVSDRIRAAIEVLPPKCREIFCKSRFEEMKYVEISEELHISVKTVEAQIGKALKILRESLSDIITVLILISALFK